MTRHAEILNMMRKAHPAMHFKAFRRNMLEAFGEKGERVVWLLDRFHYVPDAYFLRPEVPEVQVFEVIVWHGLSQPKLGAYYELTRALGDVGVTFEVWVVDENGNSGMLSIAPV
jgi:hypothetical protein